MKTTLIIIANIVITMSIIAAYDYVFTKQIFLDQPDKAGIVEIPPTLVPETGTEPVEVVNEENEVEQFQVSGKVDSLDKDYELPESDLETFESLSPEEQKEYAEKSQPIY